MKSTPLRQGAALASLAILSTTVLSACGGEAAGGSGAAGQKVLRVAVATTSECNDPQLDNYGFGSTIGRQIVDSLVERDAEDPTKINPWPHPRLPAHRSTQRPHPEMTNGPTFP